MSVSKRLRYEVLRRDNHACRYCGATAPGVALVVDHVVPVALGGTDLPTNLVAACSPCNSGKSATPVDAARVADVAADALRWGLAMQESGKVMARQTQHRDFVREFFYDAWLSRAGHDYDLPVAWGSTIDSLAAASFDQIDFEDICEITWERDRRDPFRYFCGVAWNKVSQLQEAAAATLHAQGER